MTQEKDSSFLPLKTQNAISRLSGVINIGSILEYATTLHDPQELKVIKQMISDIGLRSRCRKADVAECVGFVDNLINETYAPKILYQNNDRCQQFFGDMRNNKFHSINTKRKNKIV